MFSRCNISFLQPIDLSTCFTKLDNNLTDLKNFIVESLPSLKMVDKNILLRPEAVQSAGFVEKLKSIVANNRPEIASLISRLIGISFGATVSYFLFKYLMKQIDPTNNDKLSAITKAEYIMKELGVSNIEFNEYELCIASNLVLPRNIECSWQDIGGLEHIIDDLKTTVIYPLKNFNTSNTGIKNSLATSNALGKRSKLIQPPKGVLLFGPPGNAKTMIAKALAKESGARFINLQVSILFDKWFGESQKRTEAIFTLAEKVQPVIIFIDEIDSFLRSRKSEDHECTNTIKTQFMTLWDGLATLQRNNQILIVGATNRPEDVDAAILRRMPQMFYIGLPQKPARKKILNIILKDENLAADIDLDEIAELTESFSGSDLHELCRCAAMNSFIDHLKNVNNETGDTDPSSNDSQSIIYIKKIDFEAAFRKMSVKNLTNINKFFEDGKLD